VSGNGGAAKLGGSDVAGFYPCILATLVEVYVEIAHKSILKLIFRV